MFDDQDIKNAQQVISLETGSTSKLSAIAKLVILVGLTLSILAGGGLPEKMKLIARLSSTTEEKVKPVAPADSQTIIINDSTLENVTINQRIHNTSAKNKR
ncbi:MAG TPA: hypothetical protein VF604_16820 [Pyrinomonadaceae bacterium]|jgi:hypothetical protein